MWKPCGDDFISDGWIGGDFISDGCTDDCAGDGGHPATTVLGRLPTHGVGALGDGSRGWGGGHLVEQAEADLVDGGLWLM